MGFMVLENIGDFISLKNDIPYVGITRVYDYDITINTQNPETVLREFRWSTDNQTFSSWIKLEPNSIRDLNLSNNEIWFEIRITNTDGNQVEVDPESFRLSYDTLKDPRYSMAKPPDIICSETGNWAGLSRIPDLCFKPYDVNPAICLHQELSYHVNKMFGHDVDYFRAVADDRAKDIIIKEHTIYNVLDPVCIKVLVPDNQFPDNTQQYNPFGMSFEQPFEVEVDKNVWKEFFPDNTGPQKRDVLYFKITNRFYEIISSHIVRGFMEKETHWKISLIKYSPKVNRKEPDSLKTAINSLTTSMEKEFGKERKEEEIKETKPQQYTPDPTDKRKDPIRGFLNKSIQITQEPLKNYGSVISEQHYDLRNLVSNGPTIAVEYLPHVNILSDISYSAWISEQNPTYFNPIDRVETMGVSGSDMIVEISKNRNYRVGDYLKIFKGTSLVIYGEIQSIISDRRFGLKVDTEIITQLNTINSMWSGLGGWSCEKIYKSNLIDGYNNGTGIKIDLVASKFFKVQLDDKNYTFILEDSLKKDNWYGIYINISKKFRQIEINVWERKWIEDIYSSPQTTDLFNIYNIIQNNIDIPDIETEHTYKLLSGNMKITNIRLFDNIAEIEKQPAILNQNIVKDAQRSIIIDNAIPRYYLPHITN